MAKNGTPDWPWLHSWPTLIARTVMTMVLAYVAFSRALDTGSYWEYLIGFILLAFSIKFIVQLFRYGQKV